MLAPSTLSFQCSNIGTKNILCKVCIAICHWEIIHDILYLKNLIVISSCVTGDMINLPCLFSILKSSLGVSLPILFYSRYHGTYLNSTYIDFWYHVLLLRYILQVYYWWFGGIQAFCCCLKVSNYWFCVYQECIFLVRIIGDSVFSFQILETRFISHLYCIIPFIAYYFHICLECQPLCCVIGSRSHCIPACSGICTEVRFHNSFFQFLSYFRKDHFSSGRVFLSSVYPPLLLVPF